jgi:hypothetical protein
MLSFPRMEPCGFGIGLEIRLPRSRILPNCYSASAIAVNITRTSRHPGHHAGMESALTEAVFVTHG